MSNPVQLRVRGDETVRETFKRAEGEFDPDTYGALITDLCEFALNNKSEFERFRKRETRPTNQQSSRR